MGLWMKFGEIENMTRITKGNSTAYRNTKSAIENSFKPKRLKEIARETMYSDLSDMASERASYLSGLSRRERKRLEKQKEEQKNVQNEKKNRFDEAATDPNKPEHWLKKLYEYYARENDYGRGEIEKHLLEYGDAVYPLVRGYVFTLADQYKTYTGGITEIRFSTDEGRRTKAVIDTYTNGMNYGIMFLGKFTHPNRVKDIADFYHFIDRNIYSDPQSGFGDMFNAVRIRQHAVRAMGTASKDHGETLPLYLAALKDESCFVRWEAIDILKKQWTPEEVRSNTTLNQALTEAEKKEDNGVSNRKEALAYLLGKKA